MSAALAGFIDQDDDLRNGNLSFAEPLDAEVRRAIQNTLSPGAPLVRQFPTGLTLDEDHLRFREPQERISIAVNVLQAAKLEQVVHHASADLVINLRGSAHRAGPQGNKLGSWIGRTTRAIMLAIVIIASATATGVSQKIGEKFAEKSEMVRRFSSFLVQQEKSILELTKDLPPDIRAKIREVIRRIKEGPSQPRSPTPTNTTPV